MLKIKFLIISLVIFVSGYAQQSALKHNVVNIDGKNYIIHIIKKGETLFNISKQYNTKLDSILSANPLLNTSSLEIGSPLKIPFYENPKNQHDTIFHTVKKGETIYSIARHYEIKPNVIFENNPGADKNISIDQKLVIIKKFDDQKLTELSKEITPQSNNLQLDTSKWIYHTVEPKETLYGISRQYNVSIETITENNPELTEQEGLKINSILKIPNNAFLSSGTNDTDTEESNFSNDVILCNKKPINSAINIAIMLPFFASNSSYDTIVSTGRIKHIPARSKQFIEFYQGVLLALEDLKNRGLQATLFVYDTQDDVNITRNICHLPEFNSFDLIIGPVIGKNIEIVAEYAKKNNIPVVSPLSTDDKFISEFENSFMVSPSTKIQEIKTIKAIKQMNKRNYVIVTEGNQYDLLYISTLKKEILSLDNPNNKVKYTEFAYKKGNEQKLLDLFVPRDTAVIVILSDEKAFISDIVARLNTVSEKCDVTLFGQPKWSKFDNIKLEFFYNLNTHIFTLNYIDYANQRVRDFVLKYRQSYYTEPTARAFEGYDIAYYFVDALITFGKNFRHCLEYHYPELLNMKFDFRQIHKGDGYINHHLYLNNYSRNYELKVME